MADRRIGLLALIAFGAMSLYAVLTGAVLDPAVRLLGGLALLFVAPGAALSAALLPANRLGFPERALLAVALSLASVVASGLLLHLTPWGLEPTAWAAMLGGATLALSCVGLARRWHEPVERHSWRAGPPGPAGLTGAALGLVAVATIVGSMRLDDASARTHQGQGFTQLWLLPAPQNGSAGAIEVGLQNCEGTSQQYVLTLTVNDQLYQQWRSLELAPNDAWDVLVALPPEITASDRVEARLALASSPDRVYRQTFLNQLRGNATNG